MSIKTFSSYMEYWTNSNQCEYTASIPVIVKIYRFYTSLLYIYILDIIY